MLKALKKALAAVAVLVLVPVEVVVRGVRTVVSMLVPQRNTGLLDAAEEVVAEAPVPTALQPTDAALAVKRATLQMSEGQRVRQAARALVSGGIVEKAVLDPAMGRDAQVLEWIKILEPSHIQMLSTADPARIEQHLDGGRRLMIPTLAQGVDIKNAKAAASSSIDWKERRFAFGDRDLEHARRRFSVQPTAA